MKKIVVIVLLCFLFLPLSGYEVAIDSGPVEKFIYLNVPGHMGRSKEEKEFRENLYDSISVKDMEPIRDYIAGNYQADSFSGTIFCYCNLISKFESSKENFDSTSHVDLLIRILEHYSTNEHAYSRYLDDASKIVDAKLLNYVNAQKMSDHMLSRRIKKDMNERWKQKVRDRMETDAADQATSIQIGKNDPQGENPFPFLRAVWKLGQFALLFFLILGIAWFVKRRLKP